MVASRLHATLQDATLDLAQHHLGGCMSGHSRRDAKTKLYVAELRLRAVTEPIAVATA
ncbi:hypothetical protein QO004_005070 [Rhizobium mesoamericanum]|uniref:hypothetical protein n=1 Tax=Rhizobium mesoamericanum TaxID=1079800 RepID=UPI00278339E6|nr:hypothetical protein [Rhizobium mesoamericanum]MDQ0563261.1 hypothetical protein [Rhizobium mesoamericanum]